VEGELESLALQNQWGNTKINDLIYYLGNLITVDIRVKSIIKRYAEIDAFSQNKLHNRPLNNTPRNMGKNDLWIAATASVLNIPLMTTDNDFIHLDNEFLTLIKV
jgi:tRNA(fMet)-specific endonuclease VapC